MIIPGILEQNWEEITKKIEIAKQFADTIHIDFIDGKFAPDTTFLDPKPFAQYSKDLFLEAHLMVEEPINYLKPLSDSGFKRFLGHIEKMSDQTEFVALGQLVGEIGFAIDGRTPLENINVPYEDLDLLLIMTINAGFSGQEFMPELLEKVRQIRGTNKIDSEGKPLAIEVDGGINEKTILLSQGSGANLFVANSCIFKYPNPEEQYNKLLNCT